MNKKFLRAVHVENMRAYFQGHGNDELSIELLLMSGVDPADFMESPCDSWKVDEAVASVGGYDLTDAILEAMSPHGEEG
jgi:hypothetical protein